MTRVLKGSHSFTCTPRLHPLAGWTIPASRLWPAFAFSGEAGTHLSTPEGWKAENLTDNVLCCLWPDKRNAEEKPRCRHKQVNAERCQSCRQWSGSKTSQRLSGSSHRFPPWPVSCLRWMVTCDKQAWTGCFRSVDSPRHGKMLISTNSNKQATAAAAGYVSLRIHNHLRSIARLHDCHQMNCTDLCCVINIDRNAYCYSFIWWKLRRVVTLYLSSVYKYSYLLTYLMPYGL